METRLYYLQELIYKRTLYLKEVTVLPLPLQESSLVEILLDQEVPTTSLRWSPGIPHFLDATHCFQEDLLYIAKSAMTLKKPFLLSPSQKQGVCFI